MFQKIVTALIVLSLLPILLYAQEKTVLKPKGMTIIRSGHNQTEVLPVGKWVKSVQKKQNNGIYQKISNSDNSLTLIDTLFTEPNPITPGSNFGFFGQDRMVMWFEAPADLYLREVGFDFISIYSDATQVEVKIVQVVKPRNELEYLQNTWWGYYEALGNGYHDATAYLDDPDRTGPWVVSPIAPDPDEIFGNDIWSDFGVGQPFTPSNDTNNVGVYQFVDLSALGYPDIAAGTIFGVSLKNLAPFTLGRVGIFGDPVGTGGTYQFPLWKYYADQNTNTGTPPDDWGWWSRDIPLLYAAVVEIYGNTAPFINSFTSIPSDVVLGPFTVDANITDENPGNPDSAGVASAMIQWSTTGGEPWNDVPMTDMGSNNWSGEIPAQSPNTTVTYRISATDITNLTATGNSVSFHIFQPSGANTLVVFNGFNQLTGFPQDWYWSPGVEFDHDTWNYGKVTTALLGNYTNVVEIWNENTGVYNDDVIRPWIEGASNRNYFLAGQEWIGTKNGFVDSVYVAGDFEYDILGLAAGFNDVSYDTANAVGQNDPTLVTPQGGTRFGQPLLDLFNSITPPPDSMMYFPTYITGNANWQDCFDIVTGAGVEVDMTVEARKEPTPYTKPTLAHRTLTAGNKIVFAAFDPISLTTGTDSSFAYFNWVGPDTANVVFQALRWFDIPVGVNESEGLTPSEFVLEQNYPNPFNPSTTIKFSITEPAKVTLKIYDVLGREVSTLVNETKNVGNYVVDFDASGLASGMYIYKINAGNFTTSKKMMLLK
jgi:hypothetical protein